MEGGTADRRHHAMVHVHFTLDFSYPRQRAKSRPGRAIHVPPYHLHPDQSCPACLRPRTAPCQSRLDLQRQQHAGSDRRRYERRHLRDRRGHLHPARGDHAGQPGIRLRRGDHPCAGRGLQAGASAHRDRRGARWRPGSECARDRQSADPHPRQRPRHDHHRCRTDRSRAVGGSPAPRHHQGSHPAQRPCSGRRRRTAQCRRSDTRSRGCARFPRDRVRWRNLQRDACDGKSQHDRRACHVQPRRVRWWNRQRWSHHD